ncbi:MAG: pyruvate kinase [Halieaceae bacterium]|nr:pyruvate kinase [Halieaceae bacterium]
MKIKNNRRTKIVSTIGPNSESADMVSRLIKAGVDVFRLNFSHGNLDQHCRVAKLIRKHAAIEGRYVGVLADLQGPKIRIGDFVNGEVDLKIGDKFSLNLTEEEIKGTIRGVGVPYKDLSKQVNLNDIMLLDDGRIRLKIDEVQESEVDCTVLVGGKLSSRKGINRLGGGLAAAALTDKDVSDIDCFKSIRPDFVAVSFVGSTDDIDRAKDLLKNININPSIIAKIERAEVVGDTDLLDSILEATSGVMVARGDLGVEVGDAQLIGIQKD